MPADPGSAASTQPDLDIDLADLEKLAAELAERSLRADLHAPNGRLPYLQVRNPHVSVLSETVYAQAGAFWFSWGERIARCDQAGTAAGILARVLRSTGAGD